MKFNYLFIVVLLLAQCGFAQPTRFWIQFKDKNDSPFSIQNPSSFLSQRAIDRRTKQNINIQENDLPVNPAYIDSVKAKGATVLNRSRWLNAITIYTNDNNILNAVLALPFVKTHKTVGLFRREGERVYDKFSKEMALPASTSFKTNFSSSDYGQSFAQINMVNGVCLHNKGYQGQGIQIAVIDEGFLGVDQMAAFDSVRAWGGILGTRDFVQGDNNVYDIGSHGTGVFSIMGAYIPGQLIGSAPKAGYWLLRSEDNASEYLIEEDNWVAAVEFADSVGADVVNTSLGYNEFGDASQNHAYADMNGRTTHAAIAATIAARKGMFLCMAAGNEGNNSWRYITTPADADSVITVGSVDAGKNRASNSSVGPTYDRRIKPDVMAMGQGATLLNSSGSVTTSGGTSFAAPIIAGMAACLWQARPSLTPVRLLEYIRASADNYATPDSLYGYGIPDFCEAELISGVTTSVIRNTMNFDVIPIPFESSMEITFYSPNDQEVTLTLTDITGKQLVIQKEFAYFKKRNYFLMQGLDRLQCGMYLLNIISSQGNSVKKVLKK